MGAWIEITATATEPAEPLSLPAWGRGLKCSTKVQQGRRLQSLPAWGRGLKFVIYNRQHSGKFVAPRMGAWIEIGL